MPSRPPPQLLSAATSVSCSSESADRNDAMAAKDGFGGSLEGFFGRIFQEFVEFDRFSTLNVDVSQLLMEIVFEVPDVFRRFDRFCLRFLEFASFFFRDLEIFF